MSQDTIYNMITDRICDLLKSGEIPWKRPWKGFAAVPQNLISKKPYRGINHFILHSLGETPYWLTYKQAEAKGRPRSQGRTRYSDCFLETT